MMDDDDKLELLKKKLNSPPELVIFSDNPIDIALENDWMSLAGKMGPLYNIIRQPLTQTPFTAAIYGDWGTGKTSAMRWLDGRLQDWTESKNGLEILTLWFHPWKYQEKEDVWRGLIAEVIIKCITTPNINLETTWGEAKAWLGLLGNIGKAVLDGFEVSGKVLKFKGQAIGKAAEQIHAFANPQAAYLNEFEKAMREWIKKTISTEQRLVVFIDDLDRCMPEIALKVLEALKLYLDIPNLIFIIGVDDSVVNQLVLKHYEGQGVNPEKAKNYLSKIFQIETRLRPDEEEMRGFLVRMLENNPTWRDLPEDAKQNFTEVLHNLSELSPREIKRLLNTALIAADGANMMDGKRISPEQAIQVNLIHYILDKRYGNGKIAAPKYGAGFFNAWSDEVRSGKVIDHATIKSNPALQNFAADQDLISFLRDENLGLLVGVAEYPSQIHKLLAEPKSPDEEIINRAIAESLNKDINDLVYKDYGKITGIRVFNNKLLTNISPLKNLKNLISLTIIGSSISNIEPLSYLDKLEIVDISNNNIIDFTPIGNLKNLTFLSVVDNPDNDLSCLLYLNKLNAIALGEPQIPSLLEIMPNLTNLNRLYSYDISPDNFKKILTFPQIKHLSLSLNQGFAPLRNATHLENLDLVNSNLTDLSILHKLVNLKELYIINTPAAKDAEAIAELQKALPNLKIISSI